MLSRLAASAILAVLFACGDSGVTPTGGGPSTGGAPEGGQAAGGSRSTGGGSSAGGGDTGGSGTGGAGEGGAAPALPTCVLGCASANDCVTASVLTDADNWSCDASRCAYQGCQSDLECQQGLLNASYVCEPGAGGLPTCVLGCTSANDCATASVLTDADNWSCDASRCAYQGCQSDLECQQGLLNANYVCEPGAGGLPTCVLACASANDCVTASVLTDADNWSCDASRCVYQGCQSDLECQQGLLNAGYVCE